MLHRITQISEKVKENISEEDAARLDRLDRYYLRTFKCIEIGVYYLGRFECSINYQPSSITELKRKLEPQKPLKMSLYITENTIKAYKDIKLEVVHSLTSIYGMCYMRKTNVFGYVYVLDNKAHFHVYAGVLASGKRLCNVIKLVQ